MRIGLFHNAPSGGAKRAIYEWTRRLSRNHEVDVYTLSTADHAYCDIRPYVAEHKVMKFDPNRLFGSPFGRLNQLQRWRDLEELAALSERIAETIDNGYYDVVFAHTCRFTVIPLILQFLETPSVFYLHEPLTNSRPIARPYVKQNGLRLTIDRYDPLITMYQAKLSTLQRKSLFAANLLLANSRFTQREMKRLFGVDAPVSRLGVALKSFHPLSGIKKKPFVVSVGEMSPRKGFDFIVESLGRISVHSRPALKLACNRIEVPELIYVKKLAEKHEVVLEVVCKLDTEELLHLYNQASVCVYAPIKEPFGLVPLESMACSTPVVGVNEGGVEESIIDEYTGLLVERDPQQFAGAVQRLLLDQKLASDYGSNGRRHVEDNWSWSDSTAKLERFLMRVSAIQAED